jgi:hypothetical protein
MTYLHQRAASSQQPHRPPAPPFPEDPTKATRHLCAGAYLDDDFRNDVLREVYYQSRRIVAPSYGFDAVPVLGHCLRARNGAIVRDGAIIVTVLAAACFSWPALLLALSMMVQLQLTVSTYRLVRDTFRKLRDGEAIPLGTLGPRAIMLGLGWTALFLANLMAILAVYSSMYDSYREFGAVEEPELMGSGAAFGSLMLALLIVLFPVGFSLWRQAELARLTPGTQVGVPVSTARLDEVARQQRGNTTVYSGFWPHVGAGSLVDTWGFAQRLVRVEHPAIRDLNGLGQAPTHTERAREFPAAPFDAQTLVDYVREHLSALRPQREAEEQIAGLTVEDRICLAGTEVSHLAPYTPPEMIAAVVRHPTTPARHYLACQVFSWGGELITTVYVHIAVQGRSLYLESTTTALPPCRVEYRIVDTVDGNSPLAWLRAVKNGLLDTPRTVWRSPIHLTAALINLVAGSSGGSGERLRLAQGYDYGARIGIRELGSERDNRFLAQTQDVLKYKRLIERRVIASVLDFLDDRGIDTAEYRARADSVLVNNGMIATGGSTIKDSVNQSGNAGMPPGGRAR